MTSKHLPSLGAAEQVLAAADAEGRSNKALRNRVLVYCLHSTGVRISELLALKWSDVDWEQARVWIQATKGSNDHYSFFHPECMKVMHQYTEPHAIVEASIMPHRVKE